MHPAPQTSHTLTASNERITITHVGQTSITTTKTPLQTEAVVAPRIPINLLAVQALARRYDTVAFIARRAAVISHHLPRPQIIATTRTFRNGLYILDTPQHPHVNTVRAFPRSTNTKARPPQRRTPEPQPASAETQPTPTRRSPLRLTNNSPTRILLPPHKPSKVRFRLPNAPTPITHNAQPETHPDLANWHLTLNHTTPHRYSQNGQI